VKKLAQEAVDTAISRGASYADARVVNKEKQQISTLNGAIGDFETINTLGIGIRVIANGSWGFASCDKLTPKSVKETAGKAVQLAKASSLVQKEPAIFADEPTYKTKWKSSYKIDPLKVPIETKLELMFSIDNILRKDKRITKAEVSHRAWREHQFFANSQGSEIEQILTWCGGGYTVAAVDKNIIQTRSYPASYGGQYKQLGYELIETLELKENAERIREEAIALLTAPVLPKGKRDIILRGDQLALQIHESCGHPSELDRALGQEISLAGGSFIKPEMLGKLKYGSASVNIVADSTLPGGVGTFGYDDDGVKAAKYHVVKDGIYEMYFTNRELAHKIGETRSRGCNRADGYENVPMIRMINLSLMPGKWEWQDLLDDSDGAILFDMVKSWSIDQMRVNFEFSTEAAWEIKGGKLGKLYRNPTYQGKTTELWGSVDAVCNEKYWIPWGVVNCGKGEPMQVGEISHGNSPARFRNVNVGVQGGS
jgi:TldD protein